MKSSTLSLVAVLLGAAVAASFFAARTAPVRSEAKRADRRSSAATTSPSAATTPLTVDAAIKELDLIRPSRPKAAHDFTLKTLNGKTFRLAEQRGNVVLVNFWATWCPPCREEMPAMERLHRAHKERGFVMVAVSVDADPAAVAPFVKEHKLTFTIALDPKMEAANAYGVRALPSSFVIDRRGTMAAFALGPRAWDNRAAHALIEGLAR
ncbi:MAG: TlpA family protein disulfide reductase [Candidatus Rokubacteria bacterium]|nr:TlpA family protein disulfide reductase [Candidatus Rokubacteria bacterium]